jgi:hypothetical protein
MARVDNGPASSRHSPSCHEAWSRAATIFSRRLQGLLLRAVLNDLDALPNMARRFSFSGYEQMLLAEIEYKPGISAARDVGK